MQMTDRAAHDQRPISSVRDAAVLWTKISFKSGAQFLGGRTMPCSGAAGKSAN
jgi:hypothetical protein